MDNGETEHRKVNKLLIKCIELRRKLALNDLNIFAELEQKEVALKQKLHTKYNELVSNNHFVSVKLHIEESLNSRDPLKFTCNPLWTVQSAIKKIIEEFELDTSCQSVFVLCGNTIAYNWTTLQECGITQNGDILYVYIAQPKADSESLPSYNSSTILSQELEELVLSNVGSINSHICETNLSNGHNAIVEPIPQDAPKTDNLLDDRAIIISQIVSTSYKLNQNTTMFIDTNNTSPKTQVLPVTSSSDLIQPETETLTGWTCSFCTFVNRPTRPGCEMCASDRPADYHPPINHIPSFLEQERMEQERKADILMREAEEEKKKKKEAKRLLNYQKHKSAVEQNLILSSEPIECSICINDTDPGEAVTLVNCLHSFCKDCMTNHITYSEEVPVKCPYVDESYTCQSFLSEREIRSLLPENLFQRYLSKGLASAEQKVSNSFHCKTADCHGWCEYDDGVNTFTCPACGVTNCLTCKAIHENMNCKEYQEEMMAKSSTDKQARKTRKMLETLVKQKEAIHCPRCNIIILKKEGCDWVLCSMCSLEICWVTKQPRWGPNGKGDTSGGCHCRENDKKCHPKCVNCH